MAHVSSLDRLKSLPQVFTLNTAAALLGCNPKMASTYIGRWKKQELVSSLGPRTGVHFNLLLNPEAESDLRMEAIAYVYPGCLRGGVTALHSAGWTTQIPQEMDIMVHSRRSYAEIDDVAIHGRTLKWVKLARNWLSDKGALPLLHPAFALADCVASGLWCPDPDDIEWDEVDISELFEAFRQLDVKIPEDWVEEIAYLSETPPESGPL